VSAPLAGRRVVVTRAGEQAGPLSVRLAAAGATVVELPTIAIVDPADGGAGLRSALREPWDWVVVTSPNGAARTVAAAGGRASALALAWAAVGPGTAAALAAAGVAPALVPERFVAEGLLESFPAPPVDHAGRVLLAQAEAARPVLADGLRKRGWEVTTVVAYRTVEVPPSADQAAAARDADAIAFTSASTARSFARGLGADRRVPPAVAIGPITADAARALGLEVAAVADPHTVEGLVDALIGLLGP
jgi:uroporphyrinogen-III synthase